jgi:hypothetical protein
MGKKWFLEKINIENSQKKASSLHSFWASMIMRLPLVKSRLWVDVWLNTCSTVTNGCEWCTKNNNDDLDVT